MQFAQYEPYLLVGLVGWSLLFFVVGLWPFDFHWPGEWRIYYWPTPINGPLNFLSFLPFGLFVAALGYGASPVLTVAIFCCLMSLSVEVAQLFLPGRFPSLADVTLNTLGGVTGAVIFLRSA
jgi:glycopeptide antibiotics resistance protein